MANSSEKIGNLRNGLGEIVKSKSINAGELTQEKILQTLDWAYDKTLSGIPGQKGIYELVDDYLSKNDKETAIKKLISFQTAKSATSGFITGFGGVITMPLTIPANIASVILVQMRMIAAIALIRGYDLKNDQVQTFVFATLAGISVVEITKKTGVLIGNKILLGTVSRIPGKTLTKINQAVGFRLVTKFGTKGAINLGKAVPVAGAFVGGAFDTVTTKTIGKLAQKTFSEVGIDVGDGHILGKENL